jgi:hypothetical protein
MSLSIYLHDIFQNLMKRDKVALTIHSNSWSGLTNYSDLLFLPSPSQSSLRKSLRN